MGTNAVKICEKCFSWVILQYLESGLSDFCVHACVCECMCVCAY